MGIEKKKIRPLTEGIYLGMKKTSLRACVFSSGERGVLKVCYKVFDREDEKMMFFIVLC